MRKLSARLPLLAVLALTVSSTACYTFDREWKKAEKTASPAGSLEGRWVGTWKSDHNGHNDTLRCLMTRTGTNTYSAYFHAMYQKIFSFSYTVPLTATASGTNGQFKFTGQADLGLFAGGLYHYEGVTTPTNFLSTYRCPSDWGTFQMHRP